MCYTWQVAKALDTSYYDRRISSRRAEIPEFRAELEQQRRQIDQVDAVIRQLDEMRIGAGMSKADLARAIGKKPSAVRRLFTASVNPELRTVAAIADALGARVKITGS
jgi:ribosome-binding protein aMBF1 (putative translation factor)